MSDSGENSAKEQNEQPDKEETQPSASSTSVEDKERGKKRKLSEATPVDIPSTSAESTQLPPWVAGGSPARYLSSEELLNMTIAMDNMALVHEIAIDPSYRINRQPANFIEAAIKSNMQRAYWDLLREDLAKDPPVYTHAFKLLMEIKQTIHDEILSDRHVRLRSELNIMLDENTLRNRLEQGCLDVKAVAFFIIELLGRLCAPERDPMVEMIKTKEDIPDLIKGIFELIDEMKDDVLNFVISSNREAVEAHSAKLEYETFLKYLEEQSDGDCNTKAWLLEAFDEVYPVIASEEVDEPGQKRERAETDQDEAMRKTTSRGYLKLVSKEKPEPFPETLNIDRLRLTALAEKFLQITIATSAVFVTCNIAGKEISESDGFKKTLKDHIILITNDISETALEETMAPLVEKCVFEVREKCTELGKELPADWEQLLRSQLNAITSQDNAVRGLVVSRVSRFVEEMLFSPREVPRRLLPGLSIVERELCGFTAKLLRICMHNRRTFWELYANYIREFQIARETAIGTETSS